VTWEDFKELEPGLAALGEERFRLSGMVLLGSLRKNGWPRISPVEMLFHAGELYLGMMWHSRKALDLLRDPRCALHNTVSNRDGSEGDFKVYGRAHPVLDPGQQPTYCDALYQQIGIDAGETEFHLFSIDIQAVAFVEIKDGEMIHPVWKIPE